MTATERSRFTIGVFPDAEWASKGLDALSRLGLPTDSLSVIAADTPAVSALVERLLGARPMPLTIAGLGAALVAGSLPAVLQGAAQDLSLRGLSGTLRHVGFQAHDASIFETLTARGGVLVAVHSEPRAADALAVLHAYGGGNASIGAWAGRL